jgi:hypothetical protein
MLGMDIKGKSKPNKLWYKCSKKSSLLSMPRGRF